jgi:tetraprenyl-beta-curcumene synthase
VIITSKYLDGLNLIAKYVTKVFPVVDQELTRWIYFAENIPDPNLRQQALASIQMKKFHAQGGSVYSLYPTVIDQVSILKFIVAFQTISDYLDNLCDRAGVQDEFSFRQLHLAMLDAVDPQGELNDYYCYYPYQNDLGYLDLLVTECRTQLLKLPAYHLIQHSLKKYIQLYTDLQALKHLDPANRESLLFTWAKVHQNLYPEISEWEFAAATGSTLGIFLLVAAASDSSLKLEEVEQIDAAYFPWVSGLHILLDYYIDAGEDLQMGDLNFTHYYNNLLECQERLKFFISQSLKSCTPLRYPKFHQTIIKGLLAMYLSDAKALTTENLRTTKEILRHSGTTAKFYFGCCRLLRSLKKI